ncbi:cytochrome P450 [Amycolatopsis anabasis]|uniref:cytochrome P450 n=1 Tax=Amycolatopsis anabasis TaxID=1840409 RepID=UPI001FEB760E|nr:cytochrome P450 [Amycolatopsis anabasis]
MTETSASLPDLPTARTCPYQPPEGQRRLRESGPVVRVRLPDGRPAWLVTGYEQARSLLADQRLTADRTHPNSPMPIPVPVTRHAQVSGLRPMLLGFEGQEHNRQRKMLTSAFTVKRVAALRPRLQRIVDEHLDRMIAAGPPADLVSSFALPVPSLAICELLGVPYADHAFFERQARLRHDPGRAPEALTELGDYLQRLVQAKRSDLGDGLLDELLARQVRHGTLDQAELVGFALVLLIAGHATTAGMISYGTLALLEHPDQLAILRGDGRRLPDMVEELLRFVSLDFGTLPRVATTDIEIAGLRIDAGDGVLIAIGAANRDETLVERPDELDLRRVGTTHLAFSHGIHQCLGQHLARAELQIALSALFGRLPNLRLNGPADRLTTTPGAGLDVLPVAW